MSARAPVGERLAVQLDALRARYEALSAREQRVVAIGAVAVALMVLVGGVLLPLHSALSAAERRRTERQEDLDWMRANADEIRMGAMNLPRDTGEAPVVLADRVGRENGLANALRGSQPSAGGRGVRVQLEAAPFDSLVTWLAALEQHYGLSVESVTVERTAKSGIVNATVSLSQPK